MTVSNLTPELQQGLHDCARAVCCGLDMRTHGRDRFICVVRRRTLSSFLHALAAFLSPIPTVIPSTRTHGTGSGDGS